MQYGHRSGELIGITVCLFASKRRGLSLHTCSLLLKDLIDMNETMKLRTVPSNKMRAAQRF